MATKVQNVRNTEKRALRAHYRKLRDDFRSQINPALDGLLFRRLPRSLEVMIPQGAVIAIYWAIGGEPDLRHYAQHLYENGHKISLPWFANKNAAMQFKQIEPPLAFEQEAEKGPFCLQPHSSMPDVVPDVLFTPLLAFDRHGNRLGQGGGHYDRWLAAHPGKLVIGVGWDIQLDEALPIDPHDRPMSAIVTQSRIYGPF